MDITGHEVEQLQDPTGILEGDRYEFILDISVDEDDELYSENGIYLKLIFALSNDKGRIAQYQFYEKITDKYLDFTLEEDEEELILNYCKQYFS